MRNRDLLAAVLLAGVVQTAPAAELPDAVSKLIKANCVSCHDETTKKGGLDLTALKADFTQRANFDLWVKVHDRVAEKEMPPASRTQPTDANRTAMVKGLGELLRNVDGQRQREQGRTPLRRLTRSEYENTIRDLFAMPGINVKDLLPEDGLLSGFDKSSAALEISAVHLRKYLEAADYILDAAIVHQDKPIVWQQRYDRIGNFTQLAESIFPLRDGKLDIDLIKEMKKVRPEKRIAMAEGFNSFGVLTTARPSFEPHVGHFAPYHAGYYRLRTAVWSYDITKGVIGPTTRFQTFALTANSRVLAYLDAPSLKPREHELVVWLNPGERLEMNPANLWPSYHSPTSYNGPAVAMDFFDVEGPLNDVWPPASHRRLFGNLPITELSNERNRPTPRVPPPPVRHPGARPHHVDGKEFQKNQPVWTAAAPRPAEDAERLLRDFLPRLFRRPVTPAEVTFYANIAQEKITAGDFFETAMRSAYRVALCAPEFLFLDESRSTVPVDPFVLNQYARANRLSYLLWGSMPDETLTAVAAKNQLHGKALNEQIDRMLADSKSDRFVNDFLDQWLKLRDIDATSPDTRLYPEFRPDLRDAMLAESRAYFREMLTKNLGAANVIDSDFVMINQRLAEHYGVPGVEGGTIRRVARPENSPRGGILTQAAVLKVTANGTSTSPVLRGVWVLDRILGKPPQPPPPDIAAVDPDLRGTTTIREQLDQHRNNAVCATCHAKIDPPGFALESFDVIGGWRTRYRHMGEEGDFPDAKLFPNAPTGTKFEMFRYGLPVDASGTTAQGRPYKDILEFKRLLLTQEEQVARNLVERLIHYATGAPVTFADRANVDKILQASAKDQYGLKTIIQQLAMNPVFNRK